MAFLFIPSNLEFKYITKNDMVDIEYQSTFEATDMDFGTHIREGATAVIKNLDITVFLHKEALINMEAFMDVTGPRIFYSTFPDYKYSPLDNTKYYAFSFRENNVQQKYLFREWYTANLKLFWHFRLPGIDRL